MKNVILLFILSVFSIVSMAQSVVREADRAMEAGNYRASATLLEDFVDKGGDVKDELKLKLAKSYVYINQFEKAKKLYDEIEAQYLSAEDQFLYGKTQQFFAEYEKAITSLNQAMTAGYQDSLKLQAMLSSCKWALENNDLKPTHELKQSNIRTFGQSFGVAYYKGGLVYSSSGQAQEIVDYNIPGINDKSVDQLGLTFLNLFYSPLDKGVQVGKPVLFSEELKFDYHVGACAFMPDFSQMFYTKSTKVGSSEDVLKIYRAKFDGISWGNEEALAFNGDDYNCAHPALGVTGDTLYFVSDMPGGEGGKDLYMTIRIGEDWSDPINLGGDINTAGDEMFPTICADGGFYFSSDFHPGYGGLDIFKADDQGGAYVVENMMQPVNSSYDDFAYILNPEDPEMGFVSSNREEKGKRDFIYNMKRLAEAPVLTEGEKAKSAKGIKGSNKGGLQAETSDAFPYVLTTKIRNALSGEDIKQAMVVVTVQGQDGLLGQGISDNTGSLNINYLNKKAMLAGSNPVQIVATKGEDFQPFVKLMTKDRFLSLTESNFDIRLTPIIGEKETVVTLRDEKFTFTFDSDILGYNAKRILEDWREFLLSNPDVRIRLNAHTDSRGSLDYNLDLSRRRAESAKSYLVQRGVSSRRIIARGYGERYPQNHCKDGVDCSDSEHEENRRVEIIVSKKR